MAQEVDWAPQALADLDRIATWISRDSPQAAVGMKARLRAAAESLADFPERGRVIRGSVRQLSTVRPYLIQYYAGPSLVRILRIRHAARRRL